MTNCHLQNDDGYATRADGLSLFGWSVYVLAWVLLGTLIYHL